MTNPMPRRTAAPSTGRLDPLPPYAEIRQEVSDRWDHVDGALMLVFLDVHRRLLLTIDIDEGTRHVDELFLRHVTALVLDLALPAVVVVVARASGRAQRVDRTLWRELTARLSGGDTAVLDLVVVGDERWWSACLRRPGTAALAGVA